MTELDVTVARHSLVYSSIMAKILSNRGEVLINHHRFPIVGKIALNNMTVEVGNNSNVRVGDEVTVIGQSGQGEVTVRELTTKAGLIVDEICMINPRVPRIYLKEGRSYLGNSTCF